ncbi:hypothetical protein Plhal304r1_c012g0044991 [Plasmopara halstedii]
MRLRKGKLVRTWKQNTAKSHEELYDGALISWLMIGVAVQMSANILIKITTHSKQPCLC